MPLTPGSKLGPYEILGPLGAGGMGEVYRATDTKLEREVAIKVLPAGVAQDTERLARFEREAKVLASLNHPHIAQIYGIEETSTERALVMELVPGQTLQTPLPLPEALRIAVQIAEALEAAHDKGIIHRDLKPANIIVTPQGVAKVLDFGLAAVPGRTPEGDPANSPTLTMQATQAGIVIGTAGYMSPEQAAGLPVDKRADIWSFGVVLWEMLCGQPMFTGSSVAHILADVLRAPIDLDRLPKETPRALRELLKRCLDRDVKTRLRDIGEARVAILNLGKDAELAESAGVVAPARSRRPWVAATALLGVIAAVAVWASWRTNQQEPRPLVRLDVDLGEDVSLPPQWASPVAISPDGMRMVYAAGNPAKLYTRRLDQPNAVEIPGTEGPQWLHAFFSPDGQWIGFPAANKLFKISVEGGAAVALTELVNFTGGSWDEKGNVLAGSGTQNRGLVWLPAGGGKPETLVSDGVGALRPQILPGSKAVLFSTYKRAAGGRRESMVEALTLADRQRKVVAQGTSPKFLPTSRGAGHLVYLVNATLFAIPFDPVKLETYGTAVPILDDVAFYRVSGLGAYDFSAAPAGHGTLVYRKASGNGALPMMTVQWVIPNGEEKKTKEPLGSQPGFFVSAILSPDGKRVALTIADGDVGGWDLWVYDKQRDATTRLTFDRKVRNRACWSPDGQFIVYASDDGVMQVRADGASPAQTLIGTNRSQAPTSFAPDGKRLAYSDGSQLWTVPLETQGGHLKAGKPDPFLKSSFIDLNPAFSPDGRWLAYQSNESGRPEVYVRAFPPPTSGPGGKWQISNNGGTQPRWSSNGRDLLYQSGRQIIAAGYTAKGNVFQAEKPRVWIGEFGGPTWDLAPDGKRILVTTPVDAEQAPKAEHVVVFLQNFFDHLRQRVPLEK